jgi:hypothetical protein
MLINFDHLPYLGFFLTEIVVALAIGAYLFSRSQDRLPAERLSLLLGPVAIVVSLTLAVDGINSALLNPWSGARMFPAIGLLYGAPMYVGPDGPGAIMNTIYPPLSYLVYMPAALFSNPTWAVLLGSSISVALYLTPAIVLTSLRPKDETGSRPRFMGVVCLLVFFQVTLMSKAMSHVAFQIHADTPMFAFMGLACVAIYRNRGGATLPDSTSLISAVFAAMAIWSKQTSVTMVAVLPLWVFLNYGFRSAFRYTSYLVAVMGGFLLLFAKTLGFSNLMFNLFTVPSKHPWIYRGPDLRQGLLVLSTDYFCFVAAILGSLLLTLLARRQLTPEGESESEPVPEAGRLSRWLGDNPWLLFVLLALAAAPTALLSRIKVGGYWCNYAPTPYFLGMGLIALLMEWYVSNRRRNLRSFNAYLVLIILVLVYAPFRRGMESFSVINSVRPLSTNLHEQSYRYCLKHPGMAYFHWHPLSGLLAEGKSYHFEYGMSDRELGEFHVSPRHFRENIPANFRYVCFPGDAAPQFRKTMNYLPEFQRRVEIPELPGWICYER